MTHRLQSGVQQEANVADTQSSQFADLAVTQPTFDLEANHFLLTCRQRPDQ